MIEKILNNYNSRYSQFMIALNMTNQKDLIRELKTLILDVEQNNNTISTKDLKRIFAEVERFCLEKLVYSIYWTFYF